MKSLSLALSLFCLTSFAQTLKPSHYTVKHHYTGVIAGKYKFLMNLFFDKEKISGEYRYYTQKSFLDIEGTYDDATKKFNLTESVYDYKKDKRQITGYFEGIRNGNTITGKWFNKDRSKSLDFVLSTDEKPTPFLTMTDNLNTSNDHRVITRIVFTFPGNKKQTIEGFESDVNSDFHEALSLEDINFDGYLDLIVVEFTGSANMPCLYWVYNPTSQQFVKHDELTASNPVVDLQTKRIVSDWRDGAVSYGTSQYVFQDNKFYLIEETVTDFSTDKSTTKKFRIEKGKSVEIKP